MNTVNREKIVVVEECLEIDAMKERESDRELGVPLERREVKVNRMMRPERNHGNMNFSATATPATQKKSKYQQQRTCNIFLALHVYILIIIILLSYFSSWLH